MYAVSFPTPEHLLEHFMDAFDDSAVAVTSLVNEDGTNQKTIAYFQEAPDRADVTARIAVLAQTAGIPVPEITVEEIPETDWLAHVYRGLHPLELDRFYIYGSHEKEINPGGRIPLLVDAATAFGSGHHATTAACLIALSEYAKNHSPAKMLDLGCGAGTLAMGMAKIFNRKVIATDIDPEAVRVTEVNAKLNNCADLLITGEGDVNAAIITQHGPYDLIMANILAQPLIEMAPDLGAQVKPGGHLILSGLLTRQEQDIIDAYGKESFKLQQSYRREDWSALLLSK